MTVGLTAVMYHYVRPVAGSDFPRLKALEAHDFAGQLAHLQTHYNILSPAEFRAALADGATLPERACLLTFDDGYMDHYDYVFPALADRGLAGFFFAPKSSLVDRKLLDVNRIQFTLAAHDAPEALASELDTLLVDLDFGDPRSLRAEFGGGNRYDGPAVGYFKRVLQHGLPDAARGHIADTLFRRHVSADESAFVEQLYLTEAHAREMIAHGMEFGGHGDAHLWHGMCDESALAQEVAGSVACLRAIDQPVQGAGYCYPFGSHSEDVRQSVQQAGFAFGFTVTPDIWRGGDPLQISRLDTNDLPKENTASCEWLAQA